MSLLKQDRTRNGRVNKLLKRELEQELDVRDDKKYEVKEIYNSEVYAKEAIDQLLRLYYLVSWMYYGKEKSIRKLVLAFMHLHKMINTFHKDHLKKSITMSTLKNSVPPMVKLTTKLEAKSFKVYTKKKLERTSRPFSK